MLVACQLKFPGVDSIADCKIMSATLNDTGAAATIAMADGDSDSKGILDF